LFISFSSYSQNSIQLRIPIQLENQKEHITPYYADKGKQVNFGLDILFRSEVGKKGVVYGGVGYFRQTFNINRPYDHYLLNAGTDSIPILFATENYSYDLIRVPLSFRFLLNHRKKYKMELGPEYTPSFSFHSRYNGGKPFPTASTTASEFKFFSHSINLTSSVSFPFQNHSIGFSPFLRLVNIYSNDKYLYEQPGFDTRYFDAIGVNVDFIF
jgi:hypothetical protein